MRRDIPFAVCLLVLGFHSAFAQQPSPPHGVPAKKAAKETTKDAPKISPEQKLALDLLETSEAASRGFEAPMRSYGLLQIGSSLTAIDAARARSVLRDSFTASLNIQDDDDTKSAMQEEIFRTLLPLSQSDVEELLPQAEMTVRKPVTETIVSRYAEKKQFDKALDLINQLTSQDEFPYGSASKLMDAMPAEMAAEKQTLFIQAVGSYKTHEHPGLQVGDGTLTAMVTRFGLTMPPKLVLQAIEEILSQGKAGAEDQSNITIQGAGGSASFASAYQYQLFALIPLLQQLDESRAKQLIEQNQDLQAKLQMYPQGMNSVMPAPPPGQTSKAGPTTSFRTTITSDRGGPSGAPAGRGPVDGLPGFMPDDTKRRMQDIAQEGENDPAQAIAHSLTLPVTGDGGPMAISPRAEALEGIARANVKKNTAGAKDALSELRKITGDLPPRAQVRYLSSAADLYMQMDEKENADKTVNEGFKISSKLLESDINPDNPNTGLKAWWPSTDAYRRFIEIEAKISRGATMNALKEIKDPEIQATESIMFARALLDLPLKRSRVVEKRKDTNMVMVNDIK